MKRKLKLFAFLCLSVASASFAQTKSTGTVTMGGMTAKIDLDSAASLVTYTITGPSNKWFVLGLHATTMSTNTPIDCVSYGTALLDRYIAGGHNQPTTDTTNNLTLVSNTVSGSTRTIVATRPFSTGDAKDYTFAYTLTSLSVIWAIGPSTSVSSEHSTYGTKALTFTEVLGTAAMPSLEDVKLYPVPAKNSITINNTAHLLINGIKIYDCNARLIKEVAYNNAETLIPIDITSLTEGFYFMEISGETGKTVKKFEVKQ